MRRLLGALGRRRRRAGRDGGGLLAELELLRAKLEETLGVKLQAQLAVLAQATAEVVTPELARERRRAEAAGACSCGQQHQGGSTIAQRPRPLLKQATREPGR